MSKEKDGLMQVLDGVLNLIINGLPSKPKKAALDIYEGKVSFVLNLIINGLPSKHIHKALINAKEYSWSVLNLIINGLPSKQSVLSSAEFSRV